MNPRTLPPVLARLAALAQLAQALLLLLPTLYLAWPGPGAVLAGDPEPEITGAGRVALAALFPAGLAIVRRGQPRLRAGLLWMALLLVGAVGAKVHPPVDSLGSSRAWLIAATATAMLVAGSTLNVAGKVLLARALPLCSLALVVPAILDSGGQWSGPLGNSGAAAQTALPLALAGVWNLGSAPPWLRALSWTALGACGLHAGLAPVWATPVVSVLVFALAALLALRTGSQQVRAQVLRRALVGVVVVCGAFALAKGLFANDNAATPGASPVPAAEQGAQPPLEPTPASEFAGLSVRASIARASLSMLAEHWTLGIGAGQFAAQFPPWREPQEIELSTHARRMRHVETEVSFPHNDWLAGWVELGLIGGALWTGFLIILAMTAMAALQSQSARASLGLAALGLLAFALVRGPLTYDPASASLAFGIFGALLAREGPSTPRPLRDRLCTYGAFLLLALSGQRALGIAACGRELAALWPFALRGLDSEQQTKLELALRLCPDSPSARAFLARERARASPGSKFSIRAWQSVLEVRPHALEALLGLSKELALAQRLEDAREILEQALRLDPDHPIAQRNLALMELRSEASSKAALRLRELLQAGRITPKEIESWAVERVCELDLVSALGLLPLVAPKANLPPTPSTQQVFDLGSSLEPDHPELGAALQGWAHATWGAQQAQESKAQEALRSYRQAVRLLQRGTRPAAGDGKRIAPLLRVEFAAALELAGQTTAARAELDQLSISTPELVRVPTWAGETLKALGLLDRLSDPSAP